MKLNEVFWRKKRTPEEHQKRQLKKDRMFITKYSGYHQPRINKFMATAISLAREEQHDVSDLKDLRVAFNQAVDSGDLEKAADIHEQFQNLFYQKRAQSFGSVA